MNALSPSWLSGLLLHCSGGFLFRNFLLVFLLASSLFRGCRGGGIPLFTVADDLVADINTQIAYLNGWACNQHCDFFLAFTAEATS
jgi:hypothetical protein